MITHVPEAADARQVTLLLAPNRALSRKGLRRSSGLMVLAAAVVAVLAAWQGNVFAPLFALLEAPCVVVALRFAWRAGDRAERIILDARTLRIETIPARDHVIAFPSAWVRVRLRDWGGHQHVLLAASGREREVGAFLGDEERAELSRKLRVLLAGVAGRTGNQS
ncbi:MAG TPA: DUF2244 domain-containing protein [Rhodanobacteraceae bacterium]|nr:DUF2244 domain-containing protein [Rhodanobacteraceae bacterium]